MELLFFLLLRFYRESVQLTRLAQSGNICSL